MEDPRADSIADGVGIPVAGVSVIVHDGSFFNFANTRMEGAYTSPLSSTSCFSESRACRLACFTLCSNAPTRAWALYRSNSD